MVDSIELEARISALELVVLTHILQSGLSEATFDPKAFAMSRRDAWASIGTAMCEDCSSQSDEHRYTRAYGASLERLGHLFVALAEPVDEAMGELSGDRSAG